MKRVPFYCLLVLLFVLSAYCVNSSALLPSIVAPIFGIILVFLLSDRFKGFSRGQTVFVIFSVTYFSFALLTFGVLTFSLGVLLFALSSALFFGRYDTMYYPLFAIGALSLFYSLTFAASYIITNGLNGFPGMLSQRAVFYPLLAWVLVTALYGILRMFASSGRKRFFTQEAFNAYFRKSAKYLLLFQSVSIVLLFFLNFGNSGMVFNFMPFKTISAYFTQPGGVDPPAVLSGLVLNAALCVPYGFVFSSFKKKRLIVLTLSVAFILSAAIELGQLIAWEGAFDVDDIILHMLGFYTGMFLYMFCSLLTRLLSRGRAQNVFAWQHTAKTDMRRRRPPAKRPAAVARRGGAAAAAAREEDAWWEAYIQ
ncbi:MAG: VanZ family protein [Bacillota bacterium]